MNGETAEKRRHSRPLTALRNGWLTVLDETFEQVQEGFLDRNTSMFETLGMINAGDASRPVAGGCANLAASVNHTRFYRDVRTPLVRVEEVGRGDWAASRQIGAVSAAGWDELIAGLRRSYCGDESLRPECRGMGRADDQRRPRHRRPLCAPPGRDPAGAPPHHGQPHPRRVEQKRDILPPGADAGVHSRAPERGILLPRCPTAGCAERPCGPERIASRDRGVPTLIQDRTRRSVTLAGRRGAAAHASRAAPATGGAGGMVRPDAE